MAPRTAARQAPLPITRPPHPGGARIRKGPALRQRQSSLCCCPSVAQSCLTIFMDMDYSQAALSFSITQSFFKLMSIDFEISSHHLILCNPLLLLPSIFPSIRAFSNEPVLCIRWPKYWNFSISPSNEYSGLISFRID